MSPRRVADERRASGLLLAFVLVASQASAWSHAVAVSHVACLEHGEAMHRGEVSTGAAHATSLPEAAHAAVGADLATAAGHDHCANAALLRWRDVALTAPCILSPLSLTPGSLAFATARDGERAAAVYLIAPKTSPPPAGA